MKYLACGEEFSKENITPPKAAYHLSDKKKEKTRDKRIFSFMLLVGLGFCPTSFVHTNAMLVLTENTIRFDNKNFANNIALNSGGILILYLILIFFFLHIQSGSKLCLTSVFNLVGFFCDFSCSSKRLSGKKGTYKLINKYCKKGNVAY